MLTKFVLHIDDNDYELKSDDLKNWNEVMCSYKRVNYDGVVRSFTSQFDFVNKAYELIMQAYLRDGLNAQATLTLYTITDRWEWEEQFSVPIDFSSVSWDGYVLKANCLDNSLAALIKSRKSTKYEFVVGEDIPTAGNLEYDRVEMQNSVTHEITGNKDGSFGIPEDFVFLKPASALTNVPTYTINSETYENSPISFDDETEDADSFFLQIEKNIDKITISTDIIIYPDRWNNFSGFALGIYGLSSDGDEIARGGKMKYLGRFETFEALENSYPRPEAFVWALVCSPEDMQADPQEDDYKNYNAVYIAPLVVKDGIRRQSYWIKDEYNQGGVNVVATPTHRCIVTKSYKNPAIGTKVALKYTYKSPYDKYSVAIKSKITTTWISRAKTISINTMSIKDVADALISKMCDHAMRVRAYIDASDARIFKTRILAGESVRGIPGAKFYSTFNDFCKWLGTVFGYTYYLGEIEESTYIGTESYTEVVYPVNVSDFTLVKDEEWTGHCDAIYLISDDNVSSVCAVKGDGKYYTKWQGDGSVKEWTEYNDSKTGYPRMDKVFTCDGRLSYVFDGVSFVQFMYPLSDFAKPLQRIHFLPRHRLYGSSRIIRIDNIRDLKYTLSNDLMYSTVTVGYDKQDYDAQCGRDEWNFAAQFVTGVDYTDKKTEFKSKYRADCYGFEFMAQERAKDTTDNKSDSTVFFVHCKTETITAGDEDETVEITKLLIDRSAKIEGALTDTVFNGEYAPYKCLLANAGYISAVKKDVTLKFASFDGNTKVKVDGIAGNEDIPLTSQLFTAGEIEFTTGDVGTPIDPTALYEVEQNGITYRGYIRDVDIKYAKTEAMKFKLIVKDIEQ